MLLSRKRGDSEKLCIKEDRRK